MLALHSLVFNSLQRGGGRGGPLLGRQMKAACMTAAAAAGRITVDMVGGGGGGGRWPHHTGGHMNSLYPMASATTRRGHQLKAAAAAGLHQAHMAAGVAAAGRTRRTNFDRPAAQCGTPHLTTIIGSDRFHGADAEVGGAGPSR